MDQKPTYEELKKSIDALQIELDEMHKAKQAIEESEAFHRLTIENISDTIVITDVHGRIIYACPNAVVIFGLSQEQVLAKGTIQELINGNACDLSELKRINEIANIEWTVLDSTGQERFLLITVKSVSIKGGAVLFVMRDITERLQAEEQLRFQAHLLDVVEHSIIVTDLDGKIVYWNTYAEKLYGWFAKEALGKTAIDLIGCEESKQHGADIMAHLKNGKSWSGEYLARNRDGTSFPVLTSVTPIFNSKGEISHIIGISDDITERKQAEQERLANIHFLDSLDRINRAMQGTNDLDQMMRDVLDEVISIFNCDRAFLIKFSGPDLESWIMPIARWRPEFSIPYSKKPIPLDSLGQKVVKTMFDSNEPVKAGPGTPFPLTKYVAENFGFKSFMGMALYPKTGSLWELGIHQCSHDRVFTTEEERLFKKIAIRLTDTLTSLLMYHTLSESEEKYRTMMESFVDPLYICSPDFTVEYMNTAMIHRMGRDATGETCYSALHGLDSKCDWCIYEKIVLGETIETNIKSPLDGRHYRVTNMPIQNQDGTISKMTIFRDITDYLDAVSEKEKAKAQLIQSQKMESIGNLAGGIAHDFNNILFSIIGFTELALDDVEKDSMIEDYLQEVYTAGKRAKELVAQILTFARHSEEEMKPTQVNFIIKEVLQFLRSSIPAEIVIEKSIDSDSLIMGSHTQLHQIMMNLCTNAAHAMKEEGGTLAVTLKDIIVDKRLSKKLDIKPGNYIKLAVSDTGIGIPPDIIDSIFEPYFTTKAPGEGSGMGLAVVHGIIESYGGKITVDSMLGAGTTFTAYFPVTQNSKIGRHYEPEQLPQGTENILFVDDEAPIVKMGRRNLEGLGYSVTTRTSSVEALELFRSKPNDFDLIITDMTMPDLSGDRLAVEVIRIRPDMPVILITGYSRKISDESAADLGIKAFAYKPIVKADLAKTVRKVLDEAKL